MYDHHGKIVITLQPGHCSRNINPSTKEHLMSNKLDLSKELIGHRALVSQRRPNLMMIRPLA
jgi:hypothetical protein